MDYFKLYDLNFNEIKLPRDELNYGFRGLDLEVSSISQDITEHALNGLPGNIITGVQDRERTISLKARIKAMNSTDYRLKRDRVYSFFSELGAFYVTESQQGNKLMKVRVIDQYTPDRVDNNQTYAFIDIPLKIHGQPYWQSLVKTMDLHNNKGMAMTPEGKWSFGMGLDVDPSKLKYQFSNAGQFEIYNACKQLKTIQEKGNCEIKIEFNQAVT